MTITLKYVTGGILFETFVAKDYNVLWAKSIDEKDMVEHWPALQDRKLDGSFRESIILQRRIFDINFGFIKEKADRVFIIDWILHRERRILWGLNEYRVAFNGATGLAFNNLFDLDFARALRFELIEREQLLLNQNPDPEDPALAFVDKKSFVDNVTPAGVSVLFRNGAGDPESYTTLQDPDGDFEAYAYGVIDENLSTQRIIEVACFRHPSNIELFPAETCERVYWATFKFTQVAQ